VFKGVGTQQLEQTLQGLLPRARVQRMDLDTTTRRGAHRAILEQFAAGEIDVLLGTQMVAKGHDFPGVTLVGVVNADGGLSLPDFRAAERTFQLLAQVAGRAGRGETPGDVYVQTACPDHPAIRLAATHEGQAFYEREAAERQALGYPPFARLTQVLGLGPDRAALHTAMERLEGRLRAVAPAAGLRVLGPAPSPIPRIRGRFREQLLIKGGLGEARKREIQELLAELARENPGVEFQVDVDPVHML
jgi:primosomal protein N' (replication factor Y)